MIKIKIKKVGLNDDNMLVSGKLLGQKSVFNIQRCYLSL